MTVNHVAGAVGSRPVKGKGEAIRFGSKLVNGLESRPSQCLAGPLLEVSNQTEERLTVRGLVDVPDLLLNIAVNGLEAPLGRSLILRKACKKH